MHRLRKTPARLVAALLAAVASPARAATASATVTVTATVADACVVNAATVAFGTYSPVGANQSVPLDVAAPLTIQCTGGTAYSVGLGDGANFSGTRRLGSGTDFLSYELYRDAGRTQRWGTVAGERNALGSPLPVTGTYTLTIYGRIPPGQLASAGAYADTVTATISF